MNASADNLISLDHSSSLLSSSSSTHNPAASTKDGPKTDQGQANDTDLLIDFADEIQVPLPPAIMTRAEVDDTFGIFSSQETKQDDSLLAGLGRNDASKLVRSFTSGRKSEEMQAKKTEPPVAIEEEKEAEEGNENEDKEEKDKNDSNESCTSSQPTVVDTTEFENVLSPSFPSVDGDEAGISQEKMDFSTNVSGGSESEYLDVLNLSSFSIPDADVNESDFIEDIKAKDMEIPESSVSAAVVKAIKLELLCEDNQCDERVSTYRSRKYLGRGVTFDDDTKANATSTSTTTSSVSDKESQSLASVRSSRLSCVSEAGDVHVPPKRNINETTTASTTDRDPPAKSKSSRLSSGFMNSSPIRASYPSSKFYMPTPNSKTPSRFASATKDRKTTESICSPSRTRNVLVTGQMHGSPLTKVPVRKSISVETLHYDKSPYREPRQAPKFSTPSASRSRYSFSIPECRVNEVEEEEQYLHSRSRLNMSLRSEPGDDEIDRHNLLFMQPRQPPRYSYASTGTGSNTSALSTSFNSTISSTAGPTIKRERESGISQITDHMTHITLGFGRNTASSSVQPMKATAIIPPTKEFTSEAKAPALAAARASRSAIKAPISKVPPRAASSPRIGASPYKQQTGGITQTTPGRRSYANNVKSSGYGRQNLNSTFESKIKSPLTSPNKISSGSSALIKPSISSGTSGFGIKPLSKPAAKGIPSVTIKTEVKPSSMPPIKKIGTALPASKILKAPTLSAPSGLRRPTTTTASNKENTVRPTLGSKIGIGRPRQ